ncbi:MAG TPA: DUF2182 domain-containing protein [Acetobacteraceae bacterium]|nr:DUF2182 domain-containing protein [Acetobacteraceae bacterium]
MSDHVVSPRYWLPPRPWHVGRPAFLLVATLLVVASVAATVEGSISMSAMGAVPMPGGWMMSMAWMRMCGQTWRAVVASFLGMWAEMMLAMMLPSLVPLLWRCREAMERAGEPRAGWLLTLIGAGYFLVWIAPGIVVFPVGAVVAAVEMRQPGLARAVPFAVGAGVLVAGALQVTAWKARSLACCRQGPWHRGSVPASAAAAWRCGVRLGLHCFGCCAGLTATMLALGLMDLRVMAIVTAAITAERLAPSGRTVARGIGAALAGTGIFLILQAAAVG